MEKRSLRSAQQKTRPSPNGAKDGLAWVWIDPEALGLDYWRAERQPSSAFDAAGRVGLTVETGRAATVWRSGKAVV
jgi:hypothetical protein